MRFHVALNGAMRVRQILKGPPFLKEVMPSGLEESDAMSQQCSQDSGSARIDCNDLF